MDHSRSKEEGFYSFAAVTRGVSVLGQIEVLARFESDNRLGEALLVAHERNGSRTTSVGKKREAERRMGPHRVDEYLHQHRIVELARRGSHCAQGLGGPFSILMSMQKWS